MLEPSVRVAAVTAFRDKPTLLKCYEASMETVLLKPVNYDELKLFLQKNNYLPF